ncbi:ATPase, T2SS/T4P/T4SS family [Methylobacterium sp. 092160098-2]|jgi:twitching motility protein PilT|uniref:ATPase, T2SS/T4P/T4SS family n=1 Tax=Methylobacterium sp. 092160098-2 TaxID=3025129 RepID=UPI002381A794|nr:ATPase, T2SS/T4P/T4SS family [Methylobacterium sp. 092160098-2]MDE4914318.1 ATPase, T2SS/T4P/T4SS family [Methylobacterium sp. 092160098-2]
MSEGTVPATRTPPQEVYAAARQAEQDGYRLAQLEFTDLYITEDGTAFLKNVTGASGVLAQIPRGVVEDLNDVMPLVFARGQKHKHFALEHDGVRYRCARMKHQDNTTYVLRRVPSPVPGFSTLGLPKVVVHTFAGYASSRKKEGLILLAGATGSGKTTTASSLLQAFVTFSGGVGVTVEDPPELGLEGKMGANGRCYQITVEDGVFGPYIKDALRWSPNYLLIGEVRDSQAAYEAIRLAVSGHLVITTIHAKSPIGAIQALIKYASVLESKDLVQNILSDSLSAVVHQKLERHPEHGMMLRGEFLFVGDDPAIRTKIREGNISSLKQELEAQKILIEQGRSPLLSSDERRR